MEHALGVIQSVGNLVASFADPPPNRKFDLDLGLNDQPKDIQDKHYKVIVQIHWDEKLTKVSASHSLKCFQCYL